MHLVTGNIKATSVVKVSTEVSPKIKQKRFSLRNSKQKQLRFKTCESNKHHLKLIIVVIPL
jgi:hypothetical protein